ncbi:hypothetical protein D3C72_2422960 [compost metagenome]
MRECEKADPQWQYDVGKGVRRTKNGVDVVNQEIGVLVVPQHHKIGGNTGGKNGFSAESPVRFSRIAGGRRIRSRQP